MSTLLKPCPECGKLIDPQAMNCCYCHSTDPFGKARRKEKIRNMLVIFVLTICLAAAVLYICGS